MLGSGPGIGRWGFYAPYLMCVCVQRVGFQLSRHEKVSMMVLSWIEIVALDVSGE